MPEEPLPVACLNAICRRTLGAGHWQNYFPSESALIDDVVDYCRSAVIMVVAADDKLTVREEEFLREFLSCPELRGDEMLSFVWDNVDNAGSRVSRVPNFFLFLVDCDKVGRTTAANEVASFIFALIGSAAAIDGELPDSARQQSLEIMTPLIAHMHDHNLEFNNTLISDGDEDTQQKAQLASCSEPIPKKQNLQSLLEELHRLTGLGAVKAEVASLVNLLRIRKLREEKGIKSPPMSFHLVFTGNPGTGKTTVARLIAEIYRELGLISKGHLTEVDRSGLVAGYVGQTAIKVSEVCQRALGGVLFIDEAYSLTGGVNEDYGHEAVDTLLKFMEDNRANFVVIVAGYPDRMEAFLESNPGLRSRFNRFIGFPDYQIDELVEIFREMASAHGYDSDEPFFNRLRGGLGSMTQSAKANFANGRLVRNVFEQAVEAHSNRLANLPNPTEEELVTFIVSDLEKGPFKCLK